MPLKQQQLPALTGLRCLLALWVVFYHQFPPTSEARIPGLFGPDFLHCILRTGYIEVSVFFVLSGFIFAYNYDLGHRWSRQQIRAFANS